MEKKRFHKVIRAFKHNGKIRELLFMLLYTFDKPMCPIASYIVTFEDKKDTLTRSYRIVAGNGIKAIDAAIKEFKNDYHHGNIDVVGLERCK